MLSNWRFINLKFSLFISDEFRPFSHRNGEFEMMTNSPNNSFIEDGILYLVPTLTSDVIGTSAIFDGYTFNISGCTAANSSGCGAVSNVTTRTVINPVQSARLTTVNSTSIQYGRVEIRAKNPAGDWLWPALWMLPLNNTYGPWPISGEIDIMESRGNDRSYAAQGRDFVRSSLNWGPLTWLNEVSKTFGWWNSRRRSYDQDFHVYALEWSDKFMFVVPCQLILTPWLMSLFQPCLCWQSPPLHARHNFQRTILYSRWLPNSGL